MPDAVVPPAAQVGRRRRFSDYVSVWTIALVVIAVLWISLISLTVSSTTHYDAAITGHDKGHCVVTWTSVDGKAHTSDVACLGRPVGGRATLIMSDPNGSDFADKRSVLIVEWIGALFLLVPAALGVAFRVVAISRGRRRLSAGAPQER
jgi:hypothetical protein